MIILLADWRYWLYVIKRQNDTGEVIPPYMVPSLSLRTKIISSALTSVLGTTVGLILDKHD